MGAKRKELDIRPFRRFCEHAGKILDSEMELRGLAPISAAAYLEKDFGIGKQTTYTRILQMGQLHRLGKDPNITIKNLCAVLDAFGLELTIKKKDG